MEAIWITLPAGIHDDLKWEKEKELATVAVQNGASIYWYVDFKFKAQKISLRETPLFLTFATALEHFSKTLWKMFEKNTLGICLYKGEAHFVETFKWVEADQEDFQEWLLDLNKKERFTPFDYHLFCANIFGEYLQRLISYLPDTVPVFGIFDTSLTKNVAHATVLLSKERFSSLNIGVPSEHKETLAICLPLDFYVCPAFLSQLEDVLEELSSPYRVIPESMLTEEWNGVETMLVFPDYVSPQGLRKLQGFVAASGKVLSVGKLLGLEGEVLYL